MGRARALTGTALFGCCLLRRVGSRERSCPNGSVFLPCLKATNLRPGDLGQEQS